MKRRLPMTGLLLLAFALPAPARAAGPAALQLFVDGTEAPRGVLHARLEIPARPGPLTLYYPKWIPGEHGPSGPLVNLAGLRLAAAGRTVAWDRDPLDMNAIRCRVPAGATALEVSLDFLMASGGFATAGGSSTPELLVLNWNQVLLYPAGRPPSELQWVPHLRLPAGWEYGTALRTAREGDGQIEFSPVSLVTLVDSPVLAGAHHRRFPLSVPGGPPVWLDVVCDSEEGLAAPPAALAQLRQLVAEAAALFGATHYGSYHFLLALSDHVEHFGLEHHESSDDRLGERALVDEDGWKTGGGLLSHEYVHSWCGKYRRPAGLVTADFQKPMRTDLLWVYEGLTNYLGWVLEARSGLADSAWARDELAQVAGGMDRTPGRTWRPLEDTAVGAQVLWAAPEAGSSWRRGADFYDEGTLIWLEADALIRQKTGGRRSLDDFCRSFFGGRSGPPAVVPFTFEELVKALDAVAPHDWKGFFESRLKSTSPRPPLGGVEAGGWRLVWSDSLSPGLAASEKVDGFTDLRFSLGLMLGEEGEVGDVVPGSAAADAGLAPGAKLLGVQGRRFSVERLREALRAGKNGTEPLELVAERDEFLGTHRLDWHGGELYPALARDPAKPDVLSAILRPRTPRLEPGTDGE